MRVDRFRSPLVAATALVLGACGEGTKSAVTAPPSDVIQPASLSAPTSAAENVTLAELRRATARYHDAAVAIAEGFVPVVEECEEREGLGRVGIPYVNLGRLLDGRLDTSLPDALLYEPGRDGRLTLVGVELAIPYAFWTAGEAPTFQGATFQREDEFGVFGLHVWLWRQNPNGLFAIANPNVSCDRGT
jgi:hypothetical protein